MENDMLRGVPMGLGMALAQDMEAMKVFAAMDDAAKSAFISGAHNVNSKQEMRQYVRSLLRS